MCPVYIVRAGETGPVKIGHSVDARVRLSELQVAHYEKLRIIRLFEGGAAEEATLHVRFADLHIRGEWHAFSRLMLADVGLAEIQIETENVALPEPPRENLSAKELLVRVETFLRITGMVATKLGVLAVNDGKFVARLRSGANMQLSTIERVAAFMNGYTRQAATA